MKSEQVSGVCRWLARQSLIAHNYVFDGAWIKRYTGQNPLAWFDTYGMFRQLATEGWDEQRWGLKTAMTDVLGWPEPNDSDLTNWLKANGHKKHDLAKAPWELLGPYNALDAGATWQLYEYFMSVLRQYDWGDLLLNYHQNEHLGEIQLLIEQQFSGMKLDIAQLKAYDHKLVTEMKKLVQEFKEIPEIKSVLERRYQKNSPTMETTAPKKHKKDGTVSKIWLKWKQKQFEAEQTGIWKFAKAGNKLKWRPFNINSVADLKTLFFDELGYPVREKTDKNEPSISKKTLPYIGDGGIYLNKYRLLRDEYKFVRAALYLACDGVLHPKVKSVATVTGRVGGGTEEVNGQKYKLNIQQLPKREGFLKCFVSREDHVLVYTDFSSLEMKVAAIASQDKNMYKLYGPDASPHHDIYLFNAAQIPKYSAAIQEFYDLDNPTKEGVDMAKKKFAKERSDIFKAWIIGSQYGLGGYTLYENLTLQNVKVSLDFCFELCRIFKETYSGLGRLTRQLKSQWKKNSGWFISLRGRPISVDSNKLKDILNRNIQSSGHDFLMVYIQFLYRRIGHLATPWLVDEHDATIWETKKENAEFVAKQFELAFDDLNEVLGFDIKFNGDTKISTNLAELKCKDE